MQKSIERQEQSTIGCGAKLYKIYYYVDLGAKYSATLQLIREQYWYTSAKSNELHLPANVWPTFKLRCDMSAASLSCRAVAAGDSSDAFRSTLTLLRWN